MWLFVYNYVSADSWVGFAEKINKKDYFLTRQWSIEIGPEISLPPCIYRTTYSCWQLWTNLESVSNGAMNILSPECCYSFEATALWTFRDIGKGAMNPSRYRQRRFEPSASVPDPEPDPYVFGPPGSGPKIYLYGSGSGNGSGSFHQKQKN
jgi:hypothetical protein